MNEINQEPVKLFPLVPDDVKLPDRSFEKFTLGLMAAGLVTMQAQLWVFTRGVGVDNFIK